MNTGLWQGSLGHSTRVLLSFNGARIVINADKNSPQSPLPSTSMTTLRFYRGKKCLLRSFLVACVANLEGGGREEIYSVSKSVHHECQKLGRNNLWRFSDSFLGVLYPSSQHGLAGQKQAIKWEMKHESNKWNNQREARGLAGSR